MGKKGYELDLSNYMEVVLVMVLGMMCLSTRISPSTAQNLLNENSMPLCWEKISNCILDHLNESNSEPQFDTSSPLFNLSETLCCPLIQQTVENDRQCFCYINTAIHDNPSLGTNFTSLFSSCEVADSLDSLNNLCQGMYYYVCISLQFCTFCRIHQ